MLRIKFREFSQLVEGKVDCKVGNYRHSRSSRFWTNFKKCGLNRLLKKWVNFAGGGQRIRPNSKIKIAAPPLRSFSSTFPVKKSNLLLGGPYICPPFAQQRISGNCGWSPAFHHPSSETSGKTVRIVGHCNSNHPRDIRPGMFGEFHNFLFIRPYDFSKFGFKGSRIWIKL